MNRKQSNGTCMTQEDVAAFKNYDAAQQEWMIHLRSPTQNTTEKEVTKMTSKLLTEANQGKANFASNLFSISKTVKKNGTTRGS